MHGIPIWALEWHNLLTNMSSKNRCPEAVFHLNNRMNVPLNLKGRLFVMNDNPGLALKIILGGGGMYFGMPF